MQIVIDIPEDIYKKILSDKYIFDVSVREKIYYSIKNCTPLPKGHGRLADMDKAIKCIEEVNGEDAVWAIGLINWACGKRTIIEADKAESEDNECWLQGNVCYSDNLTAADFINLNKQYSIL